MGSLCAANAPWRAAFPPQLVGVTVHFSPFLKLRDLVLPCSAVWFIIHNVSFPKGRKQQGKGDRHTMETAKFFLGKNRETRAPKDVPRKKADCQRDPRVTGCGAHFGPRPPVVAGQGRGPAGGSVPSPDHVVLYTFSSIPVGQVLKVRVLPLNVIEV